MPDLNSRIEQFKKMAEADPGNELGHFSLGKAYLDAGIPDGAIASLSRALELNPNLSRAYQLLATALINRGSRDAAMAQLTRGVEVAHERGDAMPKNEMIRMLQDMGAPVPQFKTAATEQPIGEGQVLCRRCGQVGARLPGPPFRTDFGREIAANICTDCWREAIAMGTKVINELRLPLVDPQAQKIWDQHIREFLNLTA